MAVRVTRMAEEVTKIPDFLDEKFHFPIIPPGDDQPLTEETVDSGYEIVHVYEQRELLSKFNYLTLHTLAVDKLNSTNSSFKNHCCFLAVI